MSETATATVETAPVRRVDTLASLTDAQRSKWLETGDLPASESTTEAPDTGQKDGGAEPAPSGVQPSIETKAEKPAKVAKPRDDINARLGQLAEQRRVATERADAAEKRAADLEARLNSATPPVDAKPATDSKPGSGKYLDAVRRYQTDPEWPKLEDFMAAIPDANVAYEACQAAQAAFVQDKRMAEREQSAQQQTEKSAVQKNIDDAFAEARTFDDFDEAALSFDVPPTMLQTIFESPLRGKLLYHFSKNPAEGRKLAAMEPFAAAREVGKIESSLSAVSSTSATPPKTVSDAPPPAKILGARHTSNAGDEVADAIRTKDVGRYIELENQRELAARKSGRR